MSETVKSAMGRDGIRETVRAMGEDATVEWIWDLKSIRNELADSLLGVVRVLSHIKDAPLADPLKYVPHSAYKEAYDKAKATLRKVPHFEN